MMITITTSGGIGGFGLARKAEVAVDELPEPLHSETCARLDPAALAGLRAGSAPRGADRIVYHIVVVEQGAAPSTFDLPETVLPGPTLDLIDELLDFVSKR
ncbi:MAG TPA: hypothetical protein PKA33_09550 [Amaricoccus sp.]|uniref:protealysin inhibitor emfourin n=1 Tax=Amaricoccus sp. TaxID=1872485 RepID=UPI002C30EB48|nr:protealysin inhibitor emfourin [Amaricoccus sp.]HMQ93519.1 hypothetical protein [Amaricoccus sp.]HMR52633.1 hypothetical protein [Amaricoccus sp.]HMR61864.1 hypothetical protein [Amaricoccus sp.]HMT99595.1 hypothetical protein [Amaricoccus sp.]